MAARGNTFLWAVMPDESPPCRHERCKIPGVHPEHLDDFRPKRAPRTKAERIALYSPKVKRMGANLIAIIECPGCHGDGCTVCEHRGELRLIDWEIMKAKKP